MTHTVADLSGTVCGTVFLFRLEIEELCFK